MKVLVDMNLSPNWVEGLFALDIVAVHWSTVGAAAAPDAEIMSFAAQNDYIVLTHDLDFGAILASSTATGPSVVQIRTPDVRFEAIGRLVARTLSLAADSLSAGALVTIDAYRTRMRILPLR